jgi:hypothetical protein
MEKKKDYYMAIYRQRKTFSFWVLLAALGFGCLLFGVIVMIAIYSRPGEIVTADPTAVLTIVAAPISTPPGSQNLLFTPTPTQRPSTITIDGVTLGKYVQISGTGGDGLRLRKEPGTSAPVLFLGYESEVFKVNDGPIQADNFVWWYLTAPYDEGRSGWAAAAFIQVVDVEPSQ